jgi:hypothetical protein
MAEGKACVYISEGYGELLERSMRVLLPLPKYSGIDKGAEGEAEIDDRPSAPHIHAYLADVGWILLPA